MAAICFARMSLVSLFVFAFVLVSASADVKPKIHAEVQPVTSIDSSEFSSDLDVIHKIASRDVDNYDVERRFCLILPCLRNVKEIIQKVTRVVFDVLPEKIIHKILCIVRKAMRKVLHVLPKRLRHKILCIVRNDLSFPLKVILFLLGKETINGLYVYPTYPTQNYPTYPTQNYPMYLTQYCPTYPTQYYPTYPPPPPYWIPPEFPNFHACRFPETVVPSTAR